MEDATIWLEVLKGGGLPAILAFLGFMAGRGGGVPVVIQLHPDDRDLIRSATRKVARAIDEGAGDKSDEP